MNQFNWTSSFDFLDEYSESKLASDFVNSLKVSILNNATIFLIGDGIFSGIASTLAGDLSARLAISGYASQILSPYSNTTFISTISSHFEFDQALSLYVRNNLSDLNLIVFLSSAGNSINLVRTSQMLLKFKSSYQINTWNISGCSGGALLNSCDNSLVLHDINTESLPSHVFYFLSKLLHMTFCSLSTPPLFAPLESNRSYTRVKLNKIA